LANLNLTFIFGISYRNYQSLMNKTKQNIYPKIIKIFIWVLVIASLGAFWISLRTEDFAMEYAIVAMVLWVIALGLNYLLKKKF